MDRCLRRFLDRLRELEAETPGGDTGIHREFTVIKKESVALSERAEAASEVGKLRINIKKNRYKDIIAFDRTRVPLTLKLEENDTDYINANFISGVGDRHYIATQGPLSHTVTDFWRMIWGQNIKVIVMACREVEMAKRKCERYWAKPQETMNFGPFIINSISEENPNPEFTIRNLSVSLYDSEREVWQLHYTAWPDHGIPDQADCLIDLIYRLHQIQPPTPSHTPPAHTPPAQPPICVHCSAGCGRTGVICTVDIIENLLKRKMINEGFSVSDIVSKIRQQRPSAVQTKDQYRFVYQVVAQMFQKILDEFNQYDNVTQSLDDSSQLKSNQAPTSRPRPSLPRKPQLEEGEAGMVEPTYAVVSRTRGVGAKQGQTQYENLGGQSSHRSPPSGDNNKYLNFPFLVQTPCPEYASVIPSPRPHSAFINRDDEVGAAPSLPLRATGPSQDMGQTDWKKSDPGKFRKTGFSGGFVNKGSDDDGYEDVPVITNSLGYNNRVSKPKGPRDPPADWSRLER